MPRRAAVPRPTPRRIPRSAVKVVLTLVLAITAAACAPTGTTEISSAPDGYPDQAPDGYPSQYPDGYPSPQVMAEVTLPDGSVATVPQPSVPPQLDTSDAVPAPEPAAASAPAPAPRAPERPTDDRAVQQLTDAAAIAASSRSLALLRTDWRAALPGWQIRFLPGRKGLRGATYPDRRVIEIYVRSGDRPDELAHVVAHELGHAVDVARLDDADRAAWRAARGVPANVRWFPEGSAVADYATPAGDWAESFAHWQVGSGWFSRVGPPPDAAQQVLIARLAGLG